MVGSRRPCFMQTIAQNSCQHTVYPSLQNDYHPRESKNKRYRLSICYSFRVLLEFFIDEEWGRVQDFRLCYFFFFFVSDLHIIEGVVVTIRRKCVCVCKKHLLFQCWNQRRPHSNLSQLTESIEFRTNGPNMINDSMQAFTIKDLTPPDKPSSFTHSTVSSKIH